MAEILQGSNQTCQWRCDLDTAARLGVDKLFDEEEQASMPDAKINGLAESFAQLSVLNQIGDFECPGRLSPSEELKTLEVMDADGMHIEELGIDCPLLIELYGEALVKEGKNYVVRGEE